MLFQRINLSDPDKVFVIGYNSYSTAAITNGQAVTWDYVTDADGIGVTRPPARAVSAGLAIAGIVASGSIAAGKYGLIQTYGYHSAVRVRQDTASAAANVAAGAPLTMAAAGSVFCLEPMVTASKAVVVFPCAFALAAQASWTTKAVAAFIKAL
jgi:hypothetical protein